MPDTSPETSAEDSAHPSPSRSAIAAIILAAGRSQRMGQPKLLLPLGGEPLVRCAVRAACASTAHPMLVVLGHEAEAVRQALPAGDYITIFNADYASGMASSLRTGIAALTAPTASAAPLAGAVILLADQPLVTARHINNLLAIAARQPEAIVASSIAGQRGTPVYFPAALFGELLQITGDEGGRSVIARHPDRLRLYAIAEAEVALDVDDPAAYQRLLALWPHHSTA
ncbi:MAG: Molybdenum cofactor cytidylyltransferase [Ktedonobacterales bacterium]|jgi:molybdenum cofactor cytidylyltransferase|nr:MAG: Molybdenum cofactor cytidylyltransferase [Ktedonobacterales bacterium]